MGALWQDKLLREFCNWVAKVNPMSTCAPHALWSSHFFSQGHPATRTPPNVLSHYLSNSYLFWIVPYPFILPSTETEIKFSILPKVAHYPWKYRRMVGKFILDVARRLTKEPLGEVLNVILKFSPLVIITTIATNSTIPPPTFEKMNILKYKSIKNHETFIMLSKRNL